MEKFLLFTTGAGSSDPLNWDSSEAALYNVKEFSGIKPSSARTLDLFFDTGHGREIVTLSIDNGTHIRVIQAITNAVVNSTQSVITIADVDSNRYVNKSIYGVSIKAQELYIQKITGNTKTLINVPRGNYSSCMITNTDPSAAVACTLHLTSQIGSDIVDTGTNANEGDNAATTSSVTLTVDGTTATSDIFLNEKVYKSDGSLFGTCTAFNSGTEIVFGNGIDQTLANNDDLYVGTRYTILNAISIPANTVLKLDSNEMAR